MDVLQRIELEARDAMRKLNHGEAVTGHSALRRIKNLAEDARRASGQGAAGHRAATTPARSGEGYPSRPAEVTR